jgi:hypothetical protein
MNLLPCRRDGLAVPTLRFGDNRLTTAVATATKAGSPIMHVESIASNGMGNLDKILPPRKSGRA